MKFKITFFVFLILTAHTTISGQSTGKRITINGLVVNTDKDPVPNAAIMIDSRKTNKTTNLKGFYKIKVKPSAEKIGICYDEKRIIEEFINGRTTINFTLSSVNNKHYMKKKELYGEEEINIGYGTVKKKDLSRSVNKLDGSENRYKSYQTIYDMIRGEVPGVQVQGTKIYIQGISSMTGSSDPLILVDGLEMNNISDISPRMVRSIEILKGSAAAIYGVRGANGVILITLISAKDIK